MLLDDLTRASRAKKLELDVFTYTGIWIPLGAAAIVPLQIPINADSDFVLAKSMLVAYGAAGVMLVNPDYLITFFDTGSGRQIQDNPVHVHNIMGSAEHPFIWPEPKLIKGSSVLTVTLQNLTAVATARVDVALNGFKVFYFAGFTREMLGTI